MPPGFPILFPPFPPFPPFTSFTSFAASNDLTSILLGSSFFSFPTFFVNLVTR